MTTVKHGGLVTVGYQGRTVEDLVLALAGVGVDVLADVRLTPLSRKPGLSKTRLAARLVAAGIEYVHLPALGNPRDNRDAYRRADPHARERFRAVLHSSSGQRALDSLRQRMRYQTVALLCFERDVTECHRELVADALTGPDSDLAIRHL